MATHRRIRPTGLCHNNEPAGDWTSTSKVLGALSANTAPTAAAKLTCFGFPGSVMLPAAPTNLTTPAVTDLGLHPSGTYNHGWDNIVVALQEIHDQEVANGQRIGVYWREEHSTSDPVGSVVATALVNGAITSATTVSFDNGGATLTWRHVVAGDQFMVGSDTTLYTVAAEVWASGNDLTGVTFTPAGTFADNATVYFVGAGLQNSATGAETGRNDWMATHATRPVLPCSLVEYNGATSTYSIQGTYPAWHPNARWWAEFMNTQSLAVWDLPCPIATTTGGTAIPAHTIGSHVATMSVSTHGLANTEIYEHATDGATSGTGVSAGNAVRLSAQLLAGTTDAVNLTYPGSNLDAEFQAIIDATTGDPDPTNGRYVLRLRDDTNPALCEVILISGMTKSGTSGTMTIVERGWAGSVARQWETTDRVEARLQLNLSAGNQALWSGKAGPSTTKQNGYFSFFDPATGYGTSPTNTVKTDGPIPYGEATYWNHMRFLPTSDVGEGTAGKWHVLSWDLGASPPRVYVEEVSHTSWSSGTQLEREAWYYRLYAASICRTITRAVDRLRAKGRWDVVVRYNLGTVLRSKLSWATTSDDGDPDPDNWPDLAALYGLTTSFTAASNKREYQGDDSLTDGPSVSGMIVAYFALGDGRHYLGQVAFGVTHLMPNGTISPAVVDTFAPTAAELSRMYDAGMVGSANSVALLTSASRRGVLMCLQNKAGSDSLLRHGNMYFPIGVNWCMANLAMHTYDVSGQRGSGASSNPVASNGMYRGPYEMPRMGFAADATYTDEIKALVWGSPRTGTLQAGLDVDCLAALASSKAHRLRAAPLIAARR